MPIQHLVPLRDYLVRLVTALILLFAASSFAAAQSRDRDNPTPLTSNEIRGEEGPKGVTYYYSFEAGPGEVVLTVDGRVQQRSAIMNATLFDRDARTLGKRVSLVMTEKGERKVERIRLTRKQRVTLQLSLDDTKNNILTRTYAVRVEGAVDLQ